MTRLQQWIVAAATMLAISAHGADNVVLITFDGFRWQEVFTGIDRELVENPAYTSQPELLMKAFWDEDPDRRAEKLLPFLHQVVFRQGTVVGNRNRGSCAEVSNDWYFSYPGYSEILTGVVDPSITTNGKVPNPQKTFLELANALPAFKGKTAAFASWDVFPFIFNVERSGLYVNAWFNERAPANDREVVLNDLQTDIPSPWTTVRLDAFTHHYALSYVDRVQPRILYISYGETDDFAHDGDYDQYILSAHRTDRFIQEVWDRLQSIPQYRNHTVLLITTDHGRGATPAEAWRHHASKRSTAVYMKDLAQYRDGVVGSNQVWMAALGPGIPGKGLVSTEECVHSNQIAATLLRQLKLDPRSLNPNMGAPLEVFQP